MSTLFFVRKGDVEDTFELAKLLLDDDDEYVQKASGGLLREAGKKDVGRLRSFLDEHAARMARTTLSYATELLTKDERDRYRSMRLRAGAARATRRGSTRESDDDRVGQRRPSAGAEDIPKPDSTDRT